MDIAKRDALVTRLGTHVSLEEFFDGNDDGGSNWCNLEAAPEPIGVLQEAVAGRVRRAGRTTSHASPTDAKTLNVEIGPSASMSLHREAQGSTDRNPFRFDTKSRRLRSFVPHTTVALSPVSDGRVMRAAGVSATDAERT